MADKDTQETTAPEGTVVEAKPGGVKITVSDPVAPPVEDDDTHLTPARGYASSVRIGSSEYQLSYLTEEARKAGHYSAKTWNNLDDAEKREKTEKVISQVLDTEKTSTEAVADDTKTSAEDVRVHMDRGIGGRFKALGGGERIRIADESAVDVLVQDDTELAPEAE
jgi:hypothetical protein